MKTQGISRRVRLLSRVHAGAMLIGCWAAPAAHGEAAKLEEIVVTARKTNEKLQITPVAVTAITPKSLERRQIQEVNDLVRAAPNFSTGSGGVAPSSVVYLSIRGETQASPNSVSDSAVGIYVDGVYYGRPIAGNLGLLDMTSAEVLRGPQGTLFGRNTTGGALNLTTAQPTNQFSGYIKIGIGNLDQRMVETVVNTPLSDDELAARFAVRYDERSGYAPNPITGEKLGAVSGDYYARASIKWSPQNVPLTLVVAGDFTHYKDNGTPGGLVAFNPNAELQPGLTVGAVTSFMSLLNPSLGNITDYFATGKNFYTTYGDPRTGYALMDTQFNRNLAKGVNANLDVDIGDVHLKSITAYRESDSSDASDLDETPFPIFAFNSQYLQRQFSQEVQLLGKLDKLDWIAGLYYFVERGSERSDASVLGSSYFRDFGTFRASSAGAFAQVNYHFSDRLRATGGFRYTWDTRFINRHGLSDVPNGICGVGVNAGTVAGANCSDPHEAHFQYPAWLASLDYQINDQLFTYLKTSGAAMSGGLNSRLTPPGGDAFGPEHVKDVEFGLKADFLDKTVRTNLAVFHSWRSGVQNIVNGFLDGRITQYLTNTGNLKAYGVEFESTVLPWDGMEITTAAAYLHAKYNPGSFIDSGIDRSGEPVHQAPKWTLNLGATQAFDLPWGRATAHADYSYVSSSSFYATTTNSADPAVQAVYATANALGNRKGYGLLNARATFELSDPEIEISFWGRNLANKKYYGFLFNSYASGFGTQTNYTGLPRTYGVTLAYHW